MDYPQRSNIYFQVSFAFFLMHYLFKMSDYLLAVGLTELLNNLNALYLAVFYWSAISSCIFLVTVAVFGLDSLEHFSMSLLSFRNKHWIKCRCHVHSVTCVALLDSWPHLWKYSNYKERKAVWMATSPAELRYNLYRSGSCDPAVRPLHTLYKREQELGIT